jgi:hypothetical protein
VVSGVVVLAAVLGGCGGGSDTSSDLTKAEFVKQANAICTERQKEWQASIADYKKKVKEENVSEGSAAQEELVEELVQDSMVPAFSDQLRALEELGAPEAIEDQVDKMLKSLSKAIEGFEDNGAASLSERDFPNFINAAKDVGVTCTF